MMGSGDGMMQKDKGTMGDKGMTKDMTEKK